MIETLVKFFDRLAVEHPQWDFIFFYSESQWLRLLSGIETTLLIAVAGVFLSVFLGVVGTFMLRSKRVWLWVPAKAYVETFCNTPPYLQLLFFYLVIAQITPTITAADGWTEIRLISNTGWVIIALAFYAGAINARIFWASIESVPQTTRDAADALGFSVVQSYKEIVLPLAFRVGLPAFTANLERLIKTTPYAIGIAVPELLYECRGIWNDYPGAMYPSLLVLFLSFAVLIGLIVKGMNQWSNAVRIRGIEG